MQKERGGGVLNTKNTQSSSNLAVPAKVSKLMGTQLYYNLHFQGKQNNYPKYQCTWLKAIMIDITDF